MKPFFTFYGGKWRAAPRYPSPSHSLIIEPFAGAAGYSTRHYQKDIMLFDVDPTITSVWAWLIAATKKDVLSLPDYVTSTENLDVPHGAKNLIGFWLNKGSAAPSKTPSSWMRKGTHMTSFWGKEIKERIANQVEQIKHWRIHNTSYENTPDIKATWFVDPPYYSAGKHYRYGSSKIDFTYLSNWCKNRKGQIIVCENSGAKWLPFVDFISIKANESKTGGKKSLESIWYVNDNI